MKFFIISLLSLFIFSSLPPSAAAEAQTPVPPMPVPTNASHVTATVGEQNIYSIKVKIHTSQPVRAELENFAVPGTTYEVFSSDPLVSGLLGKEIEATLEVTGTTHKVRWRLSNIRYGGTSK